MGVGDCWEVWGMCLWGIDFWVGGSLGRYGSMVEILTGRDLWVGGSPGTVRKYGGGFDG